MPVPDIPLDPSNLRQIQAFNLAANTNKSFFLTGKAGTGKTTLLRNIIARSGKQYVVVAPTGIAALVVGGATIHSMFGLSLAFQGPDEYGKPSATKLAVLRAADGLIIDEVSMARCDIIDAVNRTMRRVMRNWEPFGGKQVIFSGDLSQLPPVVSREVDRLALNAFYGEGAAPYFYNARVFERLDVPCIELEKVYRQEDRLFVNVLNNFRAGRASAADLAEINARVGAAPPDGEPVITLTPYNQTADSLNASRLNALPSKLFAYEGELEGKATVKADHYPAPEVLELKEGAQVMFTRNDSDGRWVNGTIGVVSRLDADSVEVDVGGKSLNVERATWEFIEYEYKAKSRIINQKQVGTFTQFPLKHAWAVTIHKSQGLTFDRMALDLDRGAFAPGQLYVALSRVRSLDGLYLSRPVRPGDVLFDYRLLDFFGRFNNDEVIAAQTAEGEALYPFLKAGDFDGATQKYLQLAAEAIARGQLRAASSSLRNMLADLRADDCILSSPVAAECTVDCGPAAGQAALYCGAVMALYGGRPDEAVELAERLTEARKLREILYVKARALTLLERFDEADACLCELFKWLEELDEAPDAKMLLLVARVNARIGDPVVSYVLRSMAAASAIHPVAAELLFTAMRADGVKLQRIKGALPPLADRFNRAKTPADFLAALAKASRAERRTLLDFLLKQKLD